MVVLAAPDPIAEDFRVGTDRALVACLPMLEVPDSAMADDNRAPRICGLVRLRCRGELLVDITFGHVLLPSLVKRRERAGTRFGHVIRSPCIDTSGQAS